MKILRYLFGRKKIKQRWIYLVAAIPFTLFALIGIEYGAFPMYIVPAVLCIVQFFYPNIFLWGLFFAALTAGAAAYSFALIKDVIKILNGQNTGVFVDADDAVGFLLLVAILILLAITIFHTRPNLTIKKKELKK